MSWKSIFAAQITAWDKIHRLVGRSDPRELIAQSVEALQGLNPDTLKGPKLLVDVGAGSGLVGIPALNMFHDLQVLFVEPDSKKTAFLRNYLYGVQKELAPRCSVGTQLLQDVSRETNQSQALLEPVLFARAFSGEISLADAVQNSVFAGHQLFVYRVDGPRHFFEKLC